MPSLSQSKQSASAFAQAVRPQTTESRTFNKVFPPVQGNEQQSALFVKKLLAVAISNITYIRGVFPNNAFGDRSIGELNLKILNDDSECPGAKQVIKWMKGCFDALDKKYLRALVIGIYDDPKEPDRFLEAYTFKFSFEDNGVDIFNNSGEKVASANTDEEIKKATTRLLRTILILSATLAPLPESVLLTMKIMYHDDKTPADYEPPGFGPAAPEFSVGPNERPIKLGDIDTGFHGIKLRIKTDDSRLTNPLLSGDVQNENEYEEAQNEEEDMQEETTMLSEEDPDGGDVKCGCGVNEDDGLMILCSVCKNWQHGICYGILSDADAPNQHICQKCCDCEIGQRCTDQEMENMNEDDVQERCLWRKAVCASLEFTSIPTVAFCKRLGVNLSVAQQLIYKLKEAGVISVGACEGKRNVKKVDHDQAQQVLASVLLPARVVYIEPMDALVDRTASLNVANENHTDGNQNANSTTPGYQETNRGSKKNKLKLNNRKRKRDAQKEEQENLIEFEEPVEEEHYARASSVKKPCRRDRN